jgi:aspartyl-tRNA(Asn)/glutamyl-tRNA(Gln) amidotransferase subunit A
MSGLAEADLAFAPIAEVARRLRAGSLTIPSLTAMMLGRIERLNPALNCYITVLREPALAQAEVLQRLLDGGTDLGPLHGIPVAIKDNIATAGIRTTIGSRLYADWIPDKDATVVARLKAAGAIILGKLNLYEFAFGGVHEDYGDVRNPWNRDRACGASSSGSGAAVAAGLAYATLGTDTGGSIRLPAAACGVVGLKATYGLISRAGVAPAGYSLDHVGPLTRTAGDAALLLAALAGPDEDDPAGTRRSPPSLAAMSSDVAGFRLGVPRRQENELIDPEMAQAMERSIGALKEAGAVPVPVTLPDHLLSRTVMWAIAAAELADQHRDTMRTRPQDYSPVVRGLIRQGAFMPATEYVHAHRLRSKLIDQYRRVMQSVDALITPVVPVPAWTIGDEAVEIDGRVEALMPALTRYCPPANITGQPAIAVPNGLSRAGLPLSVQFVGAWHEEARLLGLALAHETLVEPPGAAHHPDLGWAEPVAA